MTNPGRSAHGFEVWRRTWDQADGCWQEQRALFAWAGIGNASMPTAGTTCFTFCKQRCSSQGSQANGWRAHMPMLSERCMLPCAMPGRMWPVYGPTPATPTTLFPAWPAPIAAQRLACTRASTSRISSSVIARAAIGPLLWPVAACA